MMSKNAILVIGATQGTGQLIVNQLVAQAIPVSVLARNHAKAEAVFADQPVTIIGGDITQALNLPDMQPFSAIILTAGVTKRPAGEDLVRRTEYDGTQAVLNAAKKAGFAGRFLYMTSIGTHERSWLGATLNLMKGKTLVWRQRAEDLIRESGLPYTIIRAGMLNDQQANAQPLRITQDHLPLTLGYQVSRADIARVFVAALQHGQTVNTAFSVVWQKDAPQQSLAVLFERLQPDTVPA